MTLSTASVLCVLLRTHAAVVHAEATPFDRLLAARQLAWLVRRLQGSVLGSSLPYLLPAVLAALDDPSPAVQCQGAVR